MRYPIEPRNPIYVKVYGFFSIAKNIEENLSGKYSQKLLESAKQSTTDEIKIASKRGIKKKSEMTGDLIGNKIADNQTKASNTVKAENTELEKEVETERYISTEKWQQIIDERRLI